MSHPLTDALQTAPDQPARSGAWTLEADGAEVNPIGMKADALRLRRDAPTAQPAPELAQRLAKRATYLLEPLRVVESEPERAHLRSDDPHAEGPTRDFYDVWVTPDELSVERLRAEPGQPRQKRPLHLTWEQAERLARDAERIYGEGE